ncbi:MAG TPA: isoaspartyl peptidase/L-asparaginase [Chloroflexota bacterium]
MASGPVIVVHGGAGTHPSELAAEYGRGIREALAAGWDVLSGAGSALDAVEEAVVALEDAPVFNAGHGACLTSDGRAQLDAMIMDGASLNAGGVTCVERLRNPIRAARQILERSPHLLFAGPDAERLASELGMPLCNNEELITERQRRRLTELSHDTVGAIALDSQGNLAAATSTGGVAGKTPGRVGDSPLPGAGCYADNETGAISATGRGEDIMKLVLGKWATDRLGGGVPPERASALAIELLGARLNGRGGLILLDRQGRYGQAANTPAMPWGVRTAERERVQEE